MIYILKDRIIRIEWTILKGTSHVREDFRRANVKVFLIGNTEKYYLEATAEDGILKFDIPQGLEEGTYGIEAIWVKNEGHLGMGNRSISRSKKERLFSITEFEEEATNLGDGEVVLKFTSSTATYGYDGLSSYELAVLRGEWTGTEGEWLKHQRYVSVLDGRGDSETDTMSQKSITEELEAHDKAIEANKKAIEENKKEFDEYTDETDDRLDDVEERLDYIPKESFLSSDPAAGFNTSDVIEEDCVADRAISDRFGRRIDEEYLTREAAKNYTQEVVDGSKLEIMPGSVVPESLSPAVKQMIEAGAGKPGSITNLPDEEDITVTDANTLQFKDKEYNPYNYSGMGRVYLRKHIVNGTNVLAQHMINKPNTIYIIQYDYCLADQTIEIPDNCVLQFEGGSFRNGNIIGYNTSIKANKSNIIFNNVDINGLWNVPFIYDTWFYFNSSYHYPNNKLIKSILKLSNENIHNTIYFTSGRTYWFEVNYKGNPALGTSVRPLYGKFYTEEYSKLRIFTEITSNTKLVIDSELRLIPTNQGAYFCFHLINKSNIEFCGTGSIYGDSNTHICDVPFVAGTTYYGEWGHCLVIQSCTNVIVRDLTIGYAWGDNIALGSNIIEITAGTIPNQPTEGIIKPPSKDITIDNAKILYARRNGISCASHNVKIINTYFEGNGSDEIESTAPMAGIDFESDYLIIQPECVCKNVIMSNCIFKNNGFDISANNPTTEDAGDYAVQINNCNFTSKLRLNTIFWMKFYNCYIPAISSYNNSVGNFEVSRYIRYENCQFGELYPYIQQKATRYKQEFINCSSVNNMTGRKVYGEPLGNKRVIKMSIPVSIPEQALVTFTTFVNLTNSYQVIAKYTYILGTSHNTRFDNADIYYSNDTTPRNTIYNRIFVLSKPIYDEVNNKYIIYGSLGATITGESDALHNSLIYYDFVSIGKVKKTGPITGGSVGISGGEYSELINIEFERITIDDVPEDVTFLKEELFNVSEDISSLPNYEAFQNGRYRLISSQCKPAFYDSLNKRWNDSKGFLLHPKLSSEHDLINIIPNLKDIDRGADFFGVNVNTPFYWNGEDFMNSDGSIFLSSDFKSYKRAVHKIIDNPKTTFGYENCIYNITKNIDLNGETVTIAPNCRLEFNGGKIINGTIILNGCGLPQGCVISDYITANITGTYKTGQCLFDTTISKPIWWTGEKWVDATGAEV